MTPCNGCPASHNNKNYLAQILVVITLIALLSMLMTMDLWLFKSKGDRFTATDGKVHTDQIKVLEQDVHRLKLHNQVLTTRIEALESARN